ncbi:LamG-like jellyroll fold domain-containing protein, partial [Thomasclavelia sp.]
MKRWKNIFPGMLSAAMLMSMISPAVAMDIQTVNPELKIASYNIAARGNRTKEISKLISDEDIDVAGFQEVDKNTGRNQKDMLKEIADEIGYDQYFRKSIDFSGGEYGIGMVAKGELTNQNGADLETGGYEGRGWQRASINIDGKTVAVYNTHLTWEAPNIRADQMKEVLKVMDEDETEYKVLTGDFNAQESNDEFDVYLRNYNIANGKDDSWLNTYIPVDTSMKTNAIDNIITTRNIEIKEVEAREIKEIGSDHKVLIASCELLDEEKTSTQLFDKQLKKAKDILKKTDLYTEESLNVLTTAVEKAESSKKDTQEEINKAVDSLNEAINNLKKNPAKRSEPVAYFDFDGEEPTKDKTGRGNDGIEKGQVSYVPGLENLGNALSTKDGYVSVAKATADLNLGTEDFSVGFWYQATNPGSWAAILGDKNWDSGANPGMAVVQGQGQFYTTYAANGHGQQENIVSGTAGKVYDGKWHYIAAVLDRDKDSMLYVDGKKIAATSIASTANADATVSNPFNIGADGNGGYRIDSLIDDVKVYRTVLSPEEIEEEFLLNGDKSEIAFDEMVKKTEDYLKDLVIDPNEVKELPVFESEDGKIISKIFCSENDITINDEGKVLRQPIVDKKVQITYIVQANKEGIAYDEGTMVKNKWITVKGTSTSGTNKKPEVVPSMQEWRGASAGAFSFNKNSRIVVPADDMAVLKKAAEITKSDISEMFGLDLKIVSDTPKAGDLVLTFENGDAKLGEQGYELDIDKYLTIRGTEYRGVFFGTRSVLQGILTSGNNTIAYGTAIDYPNYEIRKFMLDIGRKYFPMWYLEDVVKYASWLKLTDFQSHISEDTFNDYSAFRLESDIPHLTSQDGYYTKDEYRDFQKHAANYGIRVITEIDGPAHARRFIELGNYDDAPEKYKNLGLDGTHFNLSEEGGARKRVLNLMDEILEEYLGGEDPVIVTDAFNVGMDEYFGNQDDLRAYAIHMYDQVVNKYHKTAFGWDSNASLANENYPKEMYPMDDIVIDYWKWEEVTGGMKKLMDQGYKVVNGDHRWYIVPGAQIGFYDYANEERLYNELSAGNMVGWYGNGTIFPEGHPNIVGGTMLLWNDRGMFAGYTVNDIFARQRSQYPYLAQSYWYGREDETFDEFKEKLDTIEVGPGLNNLYKDIDSKGKTVYNFDMEELNDKKLKDTSGNGYDATVTNGKLRDGPNGKQLTFNGDGYIEASHKALKWPYTAVFDLTIDKKQKGDIILFEEVMPEQGCVEKDGISRGQETRKIVMKEQEDGTYRLTYSRENFNFEHNFTFKKGQPYRIAFSSDESKITGGEYSKWNQPNTLHVNGQLVSTLQGPSKPEGFNGTWWVDTPSMNMPLEKIGQNLIGSIDNFQLYDQLLTNDEIAKLGGFDDVSDPEPESKNLALNKPASASSFKNESQAAKFVNDGNKDTRWGSNYNSSVNDPFDKVEWLQIDLEKSYSLGEIKLDWQDAYAKEYTIQVSENGKDFVDVLTVTDGDGKEDILDLNGAAGRYLRIYCTKAVASDDSWKWNYGYSLYEVEVYEAKSTKYIVTVNVDGTETFIDVDAKESKLGDKMPKTPLKDGYTFKEWNTKADGSGEIITADTPIVEDITIFAVFEKIVKIDKTLLNGLIEKAQLLEANGALDKVHETVVAYFHTSLANALAISTNSEATQDAVNQAYEQLAYAIQLLDFKADKTLLKALIDECEALDLNNYELIGQEEFKAALKKATDVYNDPNALDEVSILKAVEQLTAAKGNLVLKQIDTSRLEYMLKLAQEALDNADKYKQDEAWDIFVTRVNEAKEALVKLESQAAINEATQALSDAYSNLRIKPDESIIEDLRKFLDETKDLDYSK